MPRNEAFPQSAPKIFWSLRKDGKADILADPRRPDRYSGHGQYTDYTSAGSANIERTRHERLKIRMLRILARSTINVERAG